MAKPLPCAITSLGPAGLPWRRTRMTAPSSISASNEAAGSGTRKMFGRHAHAAIPFSERKSSTRAKHRSGSSNCNRWLVSGTQA